MKTLLLILTLLMGAVGLVFKIIFATLGFCFSLVIAAGAAEELDMEG